MHAFAQRWRNARERIDNRIYTLNAQVRVCMQLTSQFFAYQSPVDGSAALGIKSTHFLVSLLRPVSIFVAFICSHR